MLRKERGLKAKDFLSSEFFANFLLPFIEKDRLDAYPNPSEEGWENKYRMAYAKDEVYTRLFSTISGWGRDFDMIVKEESEPKKDIMDA